MSEERELDLIQIQEELQQLKRDQDKNLEILNTSHTEQMAATILELQEERGKTEMLQESLQSLVNEDLGWRSTGSDIEVPDLSKSDHKQQAIESWKAYTTNPRAFRAIMSMINIVTGKSVRYQSKWVKVQEKLNEFMYDRDNDFYLSQRELGLCLFIHGEVFFRYFVSRLGKVKRVIIPPTEIDDIIVNPNNRKQPLFYKRVWTPDLTDELIKNVVIGQTNTEYIPSLELLENPDLRTMVNIKNSQINSSKIRHTSEQPHMFFEHESYMYHFKVPTLPHRKRGFPFLAPTLLWIRKHRDMLEYRMRLSKARSAHVLDVSVQGTEADVIKELGKHKRPPMPGTVVVHSDKIQYNYQNPNLGSDQAQSDIRAISLMVTAGTLMPEHVTTGDASNGNFASTKSTKFPMIKALEYWQELFVENYKRGDVYLIAMAALKSPGVSVKEFYEEEVTDGDGKKVKIKVPLLQCITVDMPFIDTEEWASLTSYIRTAKELGFACDATLAEKMGFDWDAERGKIEKQKEKELKDFIAKDKKMKQAGITGMQPGAPGQQPGKPGSQPPQPGQPPNLKVIPGKGQPQPTANLPGGGAKLGIQSSDLGTSEFSGDMIQLFEHMIMMSDLEDHEGLD